MAETNVNLKLDTVRKNRVNIIYAVEHDYGARFLTVTLTEDGKKITVEKESAVTINALRPDGEKSAFSGTVNSDGTVTVPITQWMLEVEGEVVCSISAVETDKRLTTTHFYLQAQESIWDGTSVPSADDSNKDVILEIIASENVRISNENARISAENARAAAETARINAERPRIANEAIRVANEAERVSAEDVRKTEFAAWQGEIGKISAFDKRIENLEAAVSPGLVTPTVDDSVAYIKDVPTGALPYAAVSEIGGMTYNDDGILRDAKVTAVESVGVNLFRISDWDINGTFSTGILNGKVIEAVYKENTQYCFSWRSTCVSKSIGVMLYLVVSYTDGTNSGYTYGVANGADNGTQKIIVTESGKTVESMAFLFSDYADFNFSEAMLTEGDEVLPYVPYVRNTVNIPEAVQALDGYGQGINKDYHNKIVLDPAEGVKKFVKTVGCVDMGSLEWTLNNANVFQSLTLGKIGNYLICSKYEDAGIVAGNADAYSKGDKTISMYGIDKRIYVRDDEFTDTATFKSAMQGVMLIYVLYTPIETDISDYFGDDNLIGVESGGTITAVNEYKYDVPSVIEYTVKGSDAT